MIHQAIPITTELQNVRELKEAGFNDRQAEKLAELLERSVQQGFEKFVEVLDRNMAEVRQEFALLRSEMAQMESRLNARIDAMVAKIEAVRAALYKAHSELLLKIVATFVGVVSLAVAIIKLFPNLY